MKFLFLILVCPLLGFSQTFGILGDAGQVTRETRNAIHSLKNSNIKRLIMPGDNIYDPNLTYNIVWDEWKNSGLEFTLVAIGNHFRSYKEEVEYFKMPGEFYSQVIDGTRFIVLNSDNQKTIDDQVKFFENELKNARERFIFVMFHHPPFSLRHSWKEREKFQLAVKPYVLKYRHKITAMIVGHDHIASLVDYHSIPVIVSGAAFESFRIPPIKTSEAETKWVSRGGFYWTRLDIDGEKGTVWINFVRTDRESVDCSVRISPLPMLFRENCSKTPVK